MKTYDGAEAKNPAEKGEKTKRGKRRKRLAAAFIVIALLPLVAAAVAAGGFYLWAEGASYDPALLPTAAALPVWLTADGERIETDEERYVTASELPDVVKDAFVALEDRRFYSHPGYDVRAMGRAALTNLKRGGVVEGGSTITQQLVKNTHLDPSRTLRRKLDEIAIARKIERAYSKDDILAMYLNVIYFGGGAYGLAAASRLYFDCAPEELSLSEAATLAGIVKNPSRYSPLGDLEAAKRRRDTVLDVMCREGHIGKDECDAAKNEKLEVKKRSEDGAGAKFYLEAAAEEVCRVLGITRYALDNSGYTIVTALDGDMQRAAEKTAMSQALYKENGTESSAAVIDNETGAVIAYTSTAGYEIARQGGSVLKPFTVYAPAFETGTVSPMTPIPDRETDYGGYRPGNFGGVYYGDTTPREAIAKSMNAAAVAVMNYTGAARSAACARAFGLPLTAEDENLALALGATSEGVDPRVVAAAYSALARGGEYISPHFVLSVQKDGRKIYSWSETPTRAVGEDTAYLLTDCLRHAVTDGTARTLSSLPFEVAAKTGTVQKTEKLNTDAWCAGYTTDLSFAVWHGSSGMTERGGGHAAMHAARLLGEGCKKTPAPFREPECVERRDIDIYSTLLGGECAGALPQTPEGYVVSALFSKRYLPKGRSRFRDYAPSFELASGGGGVTLTLQTEAAFGYSVVCSDLLGEREIAFVRGSEQGGKDRRLFLGADVTEGEKTISHLPLSFGGKAVYRVTALTEDGAVAGTSRKEIYPPLPPLIY